jgi:hypothetical protein
MDKAQLLEKIKKGDLKPKGRPGPEQAKLAIQQLHILGTMKDLDAKTAYAARQALFDVVSEYRRINKKKRWLRKKRTRG